MDSIRFGELLNKKRRKKKKKSIKDKKIKANRTFIKINVKCTSIPHVKSYECNYYNYITVD